MKRISLKNLIRNIKYEFSRNSSYATNAALEETMQPRRKMKGWQINSYGKLDELDFFDKVKIPTITSCTDVLVKVHSTTVNPIDILMISGYASNYLNVLRCNQSGIEFPLILGREFSGTVIQTGFGLSSNLKIGDKVWGVVPLHKNGAHAEYVLASECCLSKKPENLTMSEASSILYAGLTAWSGIFLTANLGGICGALKSSVGNAGGKRVLVLGGAGGVGSTAIQILKAENCTVIATCATDAIPNVSSLGPDQIIDYKNESFKREICEGGPYDLILDCAGQGPKYAEQFDWKFKNYVTFSSPLFKNIGESGLGIGIFKSLIDIVDVNVRSISTRQGIVKWGYFVPAPQGIEYLNRLVERKQLSPIIDSTFEFENTKDAYKKVEDGHLRGKVVINIEN